MTGPGRLTALGEAAFVSPSLYPLLQGLWISHGAGEREHQGAAEPLWRSEAPFVILFPSPPKRDRVQAQLRICP